MSARAGTWILGMAAALVGVGASTSAAAEPRDCRVVDVDFTPADRLQIVAWVEDAAGNFVDTIYITQATGSFGLGNRPGIMEFNSGPHWPYGRRETVFPVWAHRHGLTFPAVIFQNSTAVNDQNDHALSHPSIQSSRETTYCAPMLPTDPGWDAQTCASPTRTRTDKGALAPTDVSLYPPREDLVPAEEDSPAVATYDALNPFDGVSQATPTGGVGHRVTWSIPTDLPPGEYAVLIETSKEFDDNATYNPTSYPSPPNIGFSDYGAAYRGQPSVVYRVPFTIGPDQSTASAASYAGYGDPDGQDGDIRDPDDTISTGTPGSGAARLALVADADGTYRVHVSARNELDAALPGVPTEGRAAAVDASTATVTFVAPGDDGVIGEVAGYQLRLRASEPLTDANFESSMPVAAAVEPDEPGQVQVVPIDGLLPDTDYYLGVRAVDDCRNVGPLLVIPFHTGERTSGEVDACFVATAAYGSLMANDVEVLRGFRDEVLRNNVLGELAVETYYTFGPAVAGVINPSELLRQTARAFLGPIVGEVRTRFGLGLAGALRHTDRP